eukprot:TRINITY_DN34131_c0_g1_i1.p1 TRINITY_DN34131_c0_g1~~TRINITY_DN34131_c0_g1_i1.p1  ORF type:complete len:1930 (-),score=373.27 TRINITY_DN34131_c0_g1_i1:201-5990(-)
MLEPIKDGGLHPPQRIACGNAHTIYVGVKSKLYGWGGNRHNQLNREEFSRDAVKDAAGHDNHHTTFVDTIQHLTIDGWEAKQNQILEVACGDNYSMVLEMIKGDENNVADCRLWSFGMKKDGQLGRKDLETHPDPLEPGPPGEVKIEVPKDVIGRAVVQRVTCGSEHTLAIVNFIGMKNSFVSCSGRAFAWGVGHYGALGTKTWTDGWTPTEIWFPEDGYSSRPNDCERVVRVTQVVAGFKHSMALVSNGKKDGVVYSWGFGGNGRLGVGKRAGTYNTSAHFEPNEINVCTTKVQYLACGEAHSGAVDQLGGLHTWGAGAHGRCGHGVVFDTMAPTRVESLLGVAVKQISFGLMHSVATTVKGLLYSWGKGPATGLDEGGNVPVMVPRRLILPDQFTYGAVYQIATGPLHTLVLLTDGTLYIFGSGSDHRLPRFDQGNRRDQPFPRRLDEDKRTPAWAYLEQSGGEDAATKHENNDDRRWWPSQVFCGGSHTMLLTLHGALWVWGSGKLSGAAENADVALLNQVLADYEKDKDKEMELPDMIEPSQLKRGIGATVSVKLIAIGLQHCLAVTEEAVMYSWGDGMRGQLGTGHIACTVIPQPIQHPTDVICVAAGEEHSACIIGGGEFYTWGNAQGGRLGLGGCMTEGAQLQPRQVDMPLSADVMLRSVHCAAEHTAVISEGFRLLTFGAGWFGRLGHGGQANKYSPESVKDVIMAGVREVQCGAYHTCIVDRDDRLWVCGRAEAVCADDHVLEPTPFAPFFEEGSERFIRTIACAGQHTLALTKRSAKDVVTELWVWGQNNHGQLGIPTSTAERIARPWQLKLPHCIPSPGKKPDWVISHIATTSAHSVCVVKSRTDRRGRHPVVYSWGFSGGGRLGIAAQEKGNDMHEQRRDEQEGVDLHEPPSLVRESWRPQDNDKPRNIGDNILSTTNASSGKASRTWLDCQEKIFAEDLSHKAAKLTEKHAEVSRKYKRFMDDILTLFSKPETGDHVSAYHIRQREREVEMQYVRILKALDLGRATRAPKLDRVSPVEGLLLQKLHLFEELLWILQQQPLYMANIATRLHMCREDDPEVDLFMRICRPLYNDLGTRRVRNLFKVLIEVVMEREILRAKSIEELFDPVRYRTPELLMILSTNPSFIDEIATPILDPKDKNSLVSIIINYTMANCRKKEDQNAVSSRTDFMLGTIVSSYHEYHELMTATEQVGQGGHDSVKHKQRTTYSEEIKRFICLLIGDEHVPASADDKQDQHTKDLPRITDFIQRFIELNLSSREKGKDCSDFQMLLKATFAKLLKEKRLVMQFNEVEWDPRICMPITSLLLGSIIGGVLRAVKTGPFALFRMWIRMHVKKEVQDAQNIHSDVCFEPDEISDRVLWNIESLAKLFRRVVHKSVYDFQYPDVQQHPDLVEDHHLRASADTFLTVCNQLVFTALMRNGDNENVWVEDTLQMDLTVDLFTSHFRPDKDRVSLAMADVLLLTNLLKKYMTADLSDAEAVTVCIGDDQDKLAKLLHEIMPNKNRQHATAADGDQTDRDATTERGIEENVAWDQDHVIAKLEASGLMQNFTIQSRFLEFRNTGDYEATICQKTCVAIPKCLATAEQLKENQGCMVKELAVGGRLQGHKTNLPKETLADFEKIEQLMQDMSGSKAFENQKKSVRYPIYGHNFMDLKGSLEETQLMISREIEEGSVHSGLQDLLRKLEEGRRLVDKVRETVQEKDLFLYIDLAVAERRAQHTYLSKLIDGQEEIEKAKREYQQNLQTAHQRLGFLVTATELCEIPEDMVNMAQQYSEELAFLRARRFRTRERKDNPTPAQLILDRLGTGKISDADKEMVGLPARNFSLDELTSKGVVKRLHPNLKKVQQVLRFVFQYENEGFTVQIFMKTTILKSFHISREDIELFEGARKTATLPWGDGFVWMNCSRLRRLLAWIAAEGGL